MTLIVEDGTGLPNAESYLSVTDYKAYCAARKYDLTNIADDDIEAALRKATDYIDGRYRFRDVKLSVSQALSFPRTASAVDYDGQVIPPVPRRLQHSTAELAFEAKDGSDLLPTVERGGAIKSETIGPLSTTYMDSATPGPGYLKIDNFLRPYIRLDMLPPIPANMGPDTDPWMGVTLQDGKGGPTPGAVQTDAPDAVE